MNLVNCFTLEEQAIINIWKDSKLKILKEFEQKCYLLNNNGKLTYEECFGKYSNSFFNNQRYNLAKPRRIIKYYHYYLLENYLEENEWYVGEIQKNGNIEFYKCCESLKGAFDSL